MFKEEEREITPELLTELSRTLLSRSEAVINVILDLVSMREKIRNKLWEIGALRRLPDYPQKEIVGYAIDSSFVQALPLVVGDFFLVTAGYIRYPRLPTHLKLFIYFPLRLQVPKFSVGTLLLQKILMRPFLNHPAFVGLCASHIFYY